MDIKEIRSFLGYDACTGSFTWKHMSPKHFTQGVRTPEQKCRMFNARYAGAPAFTAINGNGYKAGSYRNNRVTAHRMAWAWVHGEEPSGQIDHINGDRTDNRIENLRDVSKLENSHNVAISKRNKSGIVGVRYNPSRARWEADIRVERKLIFLGRFKCLGNAMAARKSANLQYGFHPNHGMR
tara:strand:- start:86 stop:631 length:546 start_codon:yes stop_codon:yes gene_type:complete